MKPLLPFHWSLVLFPFSHHFQERNIIVFSKVKIWCSFTSGEERQGGRQTHTCRNILREREEFAKEFATKAALVMTFVKAFVFHNNTAGQLGWAVCKQKQVNGFEKLVLINSPNLLRCLGIDPHQGGRCIFFIHLFIYPWPDSSTSISQSICCGAGPTRELRILQRTDSSKNALPSWCSHSSQRVGARAVMGRKPHS